MVYNTIRYSEMVKFCKSALGEDYNPPSGYDWIDVWWAITKRKKYPPHKDKLVREVAEQSQRTGFNIAPFSTVISMGE